MKQEALPDGYAVAQFADSRFYPLRAQTEPYVSIEPLSWNAQRIPFARGSHSTRGIVSFAERKLAVQYCHRYHEEFPLLWEMAQTVWEHEVYPERNVWYREEIQHLLHEHDPHTYWKNDMLKIEDYVTRMEGIVYFSLAGTFQAVHVKGDTFDAAVAALYHEVYTRVTSVSPLLQEKGA